MNAPKYTDEELDLLMEAVFAWCDVHPEPHPKSDGTDLWLAEGLELLALQPENKQRLHDIKNLIAKIRAEVEEPKKQ